MLNPSVSKSRHFYTPSKADLGNLWKIAEGLPEEWWNRDSVPEGMPKEWWNQMFPSDLSKLIETLYQRRSSIRRLITNFREHTRNPFPNRMAFT